MAQSNSTPWKANALTLATVVALAREHAPLVGLMMDSPPTDEMTEAALARVGARLIAADPTIYDSVVAAGCGRSRDEAAALSPIRKALLAVNVLGLTAAKFKDRPLWPRIRDEIVPHSERLAAATL